MARRHARPRARPLTALFRLASAWKISPRRLNDRLRIGARLADLEPTLDSSFVFKTNIAGAKRIIARAPGLKGWLASNTPGIAYSTAMHYKKLATRLRQLIGLDARIPLEWLLPGSPDGRAQLSALSHSDQEMANAARRKLHDLLAANPKITHLTQAVEQKLCIMRMVTIRRMQPTKPIGKHGRKRHGKRQKKSVNPLISQVTLNGLAANVDPMRSTAFWEAIRKILGEHNPDRETRKLQCDIRTWLNAPLQARQNGRR